LDLEVIQKESKATKPLVLTPEEQEAVNAIWACPGGAPLDWKHAPEWSLQQQPQWEHSVLILQFFWQNAA
jgi:hypothetical protein